MRKLLPLLLVFFLLLSACANTGSGKTSSNDNIKDNEPEKATAENKGDAQDAIEPEHFSLYPAYLQLPLGQHVTLDADTAPEEKNLTWSSSNPSVATVDENGRITPVAEGEAVITCAAADDPNVTAACGVLVVADGNIYLWDEE